MLIGTKDSYKQPIYLVAIQDSHAATLTDSQYFTDYDDAMRVCKLYHDVYGMKYIKVFTLYQTSYDPYSAASAAGSELSMT